MPNIGVPELIVILVIALLILGPGKLPEVGSALGKTIREFRKASTDLEESVNITQPSPNQLASSPAAPNTYAAPDATASDAAKDVTPRGTPSDAVEETT